MRSVIAKEDGTLWYEDTQKQVPTRLDRYGYPRVTLYIGNGKYTTPTVHRIVAQQLIPNPENLPQVNHIDFDRQNNHVSNLEWCSVSRNQKHTYDAGRSKFKPRDASKGPRNIKGQFVCGI